MLKGKTIILGVTGSVAAYKAASLASSLIRQNCDVQVIMTKNACQFMHPITFESLTSNKCLVDTFDRNFEHKVEHIALAKRADLVVVAPASANTIGKFAAGIADDMLTTTMLACTCKKLIAPAMNTNMFQNPIVQNNIRTLRTYGFEVIQPESGRLACGDVGVGKMPEPETIMPYIIKELAFEKDLCGKKILVTAGPTREAMDPVRYIGNYSSGKMGYAISKIAMLRGAEVTLITGNTSLKKPEFVKVMEVESAKDMFEAVKEVYENQDIIIKSAAVADYSPSVIEGEKIKKKESGLSISLRRTTDILKFLGENRKKGQYICGFSMETENMLENSKEKLTKKNIDMIVANNLKVDGAGFGIDTNVVTFLTNDFKRELPKMTKEEIAVELLDFIIAKK